MKNQYFGDINDYRKYGLLRSLTRSTQLNCMIAWMLTQDDGSTGGLITKYLEEAHRWEHHDPELYKGLQSLMSGSDNRAVRLIEQSNLLPNTRFYSNPISNDKHERQRWLDDLVQAANEADLVFLDPDNGMEVKSKPFGTAHSNKFAFWHEVNRLWDEGKSLLIYQHFIRENRGIFTQRMRKRPTEPRLLCVSSL